MREERFFFFNKTVSLEGMEISCDLPSVKFFAICPFPCLINFIFQPNPVFLSSSVSLQKYLKAQ